MNAHFVEINEIPAGKWIALIQKLFFIQISVPDLFEVVSIF